MSIAALTSPLVVEKPLIQMSQIVSAELLSDAAAMLYIRPEMERKAQIQIHQTVTPMIEQASHHGRKLSYREVWSGWRPSCFNSPDWSGSEYLVLGLLALDSWEQADYGDYVHNIEGFKPHINMIEMSGMRFRSEKVGIKPDPRTFEEGGPANQALLTWQLWRRIA